MHGEEKRKNNKIEMKMCEYVNGGAKKLYVSEKEEEIVLRGSN
jgi:hypothetical protein